MGEIKLIDVEETLLAENEEAADEIRRDLSRRGVYIVNLMASPGAGKTSLILRTIDALRDAFRIAVIEGDIESRVDAEKIDAKGIPAVQLRTGGACHLDAPMLSAALSELDLDKLDLIIVENIGNLVCPAEFDIGAHSRVMLTSVPEGDDKALKYPLMFSVCDVLLVNKTDYLPDPGFDLDTVRMHVSNLNPAMEIIPLSCRTGENIASWTEWLRRQTS